MKGNVQRRRFRNLHANPVINKVEIYFDSFVEQHLFEKGYPVKAYTERTKPTDILSFVNEERIDRIEGKAVYIKGIDEHKACNCKEELKEWIRDQITTVRSRDDNVVTRLGIAAGFQMVLDKLNE